MRGLSPIDAVFQLLTAERAGNNTPARFRISPQPFLSHARIHQSRRTRLADTSEWGMIALREIAPQAKSIWAMA